MTVVGLTNEAGHVLSLDYHTLRCNMVVGGSNLDKWLVMSLAENYISHNFSVIAADDRIFKLSGLWATPDNPDGEGIVNISANITGTSAGEANLTSAWINLISCTLDNQISHIHSDGFWGTASLSGTGIYWAKFGADFSEDPGEFCIWDLNMVNDNSTVDAIFNVSNPLRCLGYTAGADNVNSVGSIPFFTTGGTPKYIRLYAAAA
jgi:hypothetical protein